MSLNGPLITEPISAKNYKLYFSPGKRTLQFDKIRGPPVDKQCSIDYFCSQAKFIVSPSKCGPWPLYSYCLPWLLSSRSSFIVRLVMAVIAAEISPIWSKNTPRRLPWHESVPQVGDSECSLAQCITAGYFSPRFTIAIDLWADTALFPRQSEASLLALSFSAYSLPAWHKSSEDDCSVRRRQHISAGRDAVCFIKRDPSALWKRHFILTAHTFILPELEGKRRWKILKSFKSRASWSRWEMGCVLNKFHRKYFLLNISGLEACDQFHLHHMVIFYF